MLSDLDRYAFELLLVSYFAERTDTHLPSRVLGPSPGEVSALAAPLLNTPEARRLHVFVDAAADEVDHCVIESTTFAQARGRAAAWVRRSLPAARDAAVQPARFERGRAREPA